MRKYACQWIALGVCCLMTTISAARAPAPQPFSLLVVPEQMNMVQVGVDLVNNRPVALVTYRISARTGELVLHGWGDGNWVYISLDDYSSGQFLVRQPERIILVEGASNLPMELVLASGWGPRVMSVSATNPADFINAMGQLFSFSSAEWRWFASRYGLEIEQIRDQHAEVSWYDQMSAARRQPARRHAEDPVPVPIAPLPAPVLDADELQERPIVIEPIPPRGRQESVPHRTPPAEETPQDRDVTRSGPGPIAPLPAAIDDESQSQLEFIK